MKRPLRKAGSFCFSYFLFKPARLYLQSIVCFRDELLSPLPGNKQNVVRDYPWTSCAK